MIKGVFQQGKYMAVTGGSTSSPAIYNNYSSGNGSQCFTGQVRYNNTNQGLEVFDGNTWQQWYTSTVQVGLNPIAEEALDWARLKMQEEKDMHERMKRHPGLKDAWEKFKIMDALTIEEDQQEQSESVQSSP